LDQTILSGVNGTLLTDVVQEAYQDFLVQVRLLSGCNCDPTDPEDQSFELNLDQFQAQVSDLETRLVSVLSKAVEDCSEALCGGLASSHLVLKRFKKIVDLLQDFRTSVRSDWSWELESECGVILNHSLIQISHPDDLEVACGYQVGQLQNRSDSSAEGSNSNRTFVLTNQI
ncbi:hypothetical protein XENOCAPTIV_021941, partial [Xenoophorus captivus]